MDELNTFLWKLENDDDKKKNKGNVYLLFCGSLDENNKSWCPDCVRAKPIINNNLDLLQENDYFITVYVGKRSFWKNKKCIFRTDKRFKLTAVPTLIKYNTQQKLVENQCCDDKLVKMIFEDDE